MQKYRKEYDDGERKISKIEKDYNYYYRVFSKAKDTLPEYMRENLKVMSNNKGYIWRDCWFFGEQSPEPRQPLVMFEKKGPILYIHELDSRQHRIYEKHGKEKKKLVSSVARKHNFYK